MPLFLRALPLSLQTFWRYLLLLPFLAVAAFVLSVVGSFIPFVSFLVPAAVSAFCIIMGLRCALAARGHYGTSGFKQLLFASFVYGLLNLVIENIYAGVGLGIIKVMSEFGITINDKNLLGSAIVIFSLYYILISIFASLIAVPMTEAAAATPRGPDNGYFFGFGTGAFSLFLIMLVWAFGGKFFAFFGEVGAIFLMLLTALFAALRGEDIPWEWGTDLNTLMGGTLFMAWASSWFFATAVLAWESAGQRRKRAQTTAIETQRVSGEDLRALRESRQGGQGAPFGD